MLYKQNLYAIKTNFICCRDKKLGARAERARRGFFLPKRDIHLVCIEPRDLCIANTKS